MVHLPGWPPEYKKKEKPVGTIPFEEAEKMMEEIRLIMADEKLDFGPAVSLWIRRNKAGPDAMLDGVYNESLKTDG